jgi:crossover junction endonuclease MUS81
MSFQAPKLMHIPCACPENEPIVQELARQREAFLAKCNGGGIAEARARASNLPHALKKAIDSISKYPLQITSAEQALKLQFIGKQTADRIGVILAKIGKGEVLNRDLNFENTVNSESDVEVGADPQPKNRSKRPVLNNSEDEDDLILDEMMGMKRSRTEKKNEKAPKSNVEPTKKKQRKPRVQTEYMPRVGSGAYAILMAFGIKLKRNEFEGNLTKDEIVEIGQPYAESSFTQMDGRNNYYNAWKSMATLVSKEYVIYKPGGSKKAKYSLTETGEVLARKIVNQREDLQSADPEVECLSSDNEIMEASPRNAEISLLDKTAAGTQFSNSEWELILLIDTRERGYKDRSYVLKTLQDSYYPCINYQLALGDFMWALRPRSRGSSSNASEMRVLDYIIERKKVSDFIYSIKDDRYPEQKYRLMNCGLSHLIYLIEGTFKGVQDALVESGAVYTALGTTECCDKFLVHHTNDLDHTIKFIKTLSRMLADEYLKKPNFEVLKLESLEKFCELNQKDFENSPTITMGKQLQMIKGISMEKSMPIVERFKSLKELWEAYENCETILEEELLLEKISFLSKGFLPKPLGKAASVKIRTFLREVDYRSSTSTAFEDDE